MEIKINNQIFTLLEFNKSHLEQVKLLIHTTIKKCYPVIYPYEVVDYFIQYHNRNSILENAAKGYTIVIQKNGHIIGTGNLVNNTIGSVYVEKSYQKHGIGTVIVKRLLEKAKELKLDKVKLDSTPFAKKMYDKLGFKMVKRTFQMVGESQLDYFIMEKNID